MIATQQTRNAQNRHWLQALAEEFSGGRAALRADDAVAKEWTPLLAARSYDPGVSG